MFVNRAQPPPPRFGKFISTARCKALQSLYCTIRRLFVDYSRTIRTIRRLFADYSYYSSTIRGLFALFVDYSRTIRTIRRLFADYSYYSSTIRGLFVLFVDYSHYSHYSLHYSSFINCPWAPCDRTCIPKKQLLDSLVPKPLHGQKLEPISARKKQKKTNNGRRFASLNESELSKLLADKDSESTKKATKG